MLRLTMACGDILHIQSKSDCLPHWFCDKSRAQVAVCTKEDSSVFMTYILHESKHAATGPVLHQLFMQLVLQVRGDPSKLSDVQLKEPRRVVTRRTVALGVALPERCQQPQGPRRIISSRELLNCYERQTESLYD